MGLLEKEVDIVREVRQARAAAKDALGEAAARSAARVRSDTKTRKSAATREKIMAAATDLMVETGGTDFQMSEVSSRCNMSKGSLYYYFADKNALVQAIFDRSVDDLVDQIEATVANAPSALVSISELAHVLAVGMKPGNPLALAMTREVLDRDSAVLPSVESRLARVISILSAQIDRAKEEGLVKDEVDSRLGAVAIAGAFTFGVIENPDVKSLEDSEDFSNKLVRLSLGGMGTEKAMEKLDQILGDKTDATKGTAEGTN